MPEAKVYEIVKYRRGKESIASGTLKELIERFSYTLLVGESWQHEKGNKKVSRNPRTIESLVENLNRAETNAAMNGCPSTYYKLGGEL